MPNWQIFHKVLPLILILVPTVIAVVRHHADTPSSVRWQMFFVWLIAYAMLVTVIGFAGTIIVALAYSGIPGTASEGGKINGEYFFNWHDANYTKVAKETWERAYFLEQMAGHTLWVAAGVLVISCALLFVLRRIFCQTPKPSPQSR